MTALIERLQDQADEDRLNDEPEIAELWEKAIAEIERLNCALTISRGKHENAIAYIAKLQAVVDAAKYIQSCIDRGCHSMETVPDLREALAALEVEYK